MSPNCDWLCATHWARLTRTEKRTLRRLWRALDNIGWPLWWHIDGKRWRLRYLRTWRAAVRRASQ